MEIVGGRISTLQFGTLVLHQFTANYNVMLT